MTATYQEWEERSAFLDNGLQLPTPEPEQDSHAALIAVAGVGIAAALVIARKLMAQELQSASPPDNPQTLVKMIWKRVAPLWLRIAAPPVIQAYKLGATTTMTHAEVVEMANEYAAAMGDDFATTSGEALLEGFNAQVNAGWNERLAWKRAVYAYGLDSPQMRSWVSRLLKEDAKYQTEPVSPQAMAQADRMALIRADRYGENEAYAISEMGKATSWMLAEARGDIQTGAEKIWRTAEDERVCKVCGPLDGVSVPLARRFHSNGKVFFSPGVHPNCRCWLELSIPQFIEKAVAGDKYDRDAHGRFSSTERRQSPWEERFNPTTPRRAQRAYAHAPQEVQRLSAYNEERAQRGYKAPGYKAAKQSYRTKQYKAEVQTETASATTTAKDKTLSTASQKANKKEATGNGLIIAFDPNQLPKENGSPYRWKPGKTIDFDIDGGHYIENAGTTIAEATGPIIDEFLEYGPYEYDDEGDDYITYGGDKDDPVFRAEMDLPPKDGSYLDTTLPIVAVIDTPNRKTEESLDKGVAIPVIRGKYKISRIGNGKNNGQEYHEVHLVPIDD